MSGMGRRLSKPLGFVGRRLVRMVVTVGLVSIFTYLLLDLIPGNPALTIIPRYDLSAASIARVDHALGLDKPFIERMWLWVYHAMQGNLGNSIVSHQSVASLIVSRLPETIDLRFPNRL